MGKFKTDKMKETSAIQKAHRMAEAFASHRAKEFLKVFLQNSGIPTWIFALSESLTKVTTARISDLQSQLDTDSIRDQVTVERVRSEIEDLKHLISDHATSEIGILEDLTTDAQVDLHFGMATALSYAMGYADSDRGASLKQLYVPKHMADEASASQLVLPGMEK